jgi:uncharacterized coiled-coil DUF342 family protein
MKKHKDYIKKVKKTDLSKFSNKPKKVELGIVDDLREGEDKLEELVSLASYYAYDRFEELENEYWDKTSFLSEEVDNLIINSEVAYLEELYQELEVKLQTLEDSANELGMSPNELYENYDELKTNVNDAGQIYSEFVDRYKELVNDINNMGGIADFSGKL